MSSSTLERPLLDRHVDVSPATEAPKAGQPEGGLASVSKALMLLESLNQVDAPAGVSALARATGMPKSTAFRLLAYSDGDQLRQVAEQGLASRTQYSVRHPGMLMQQIQETRRTAIAFDREESQLGLSCVASPIVVGGRAVAALSVSGPTRPVPAETHGTIVRQAAVEISRRLAAAA